MNKEKKNNFPIDHVFNPITGEHLPQCKVRDKLYWDIIKNIESRNHGIFIKN